MLKEKVLFYTDCSIFGGCERPFFNIITSAEFAGKYEYKLIYRQTPGYTREMFDIYPGLLPGNITGINLPDINTCKDIIKNRVSNKYLCRIAMLGASLAFRLSYLFIITYEIARLFFLFKKEKTRIIHINNGGYPGALSCRPAAIAAKMSGINTVIMSVHNTAFKRNGFIDNIIDFFVRKCVDIAITGSRSAGRALSKTRGFDENKIKNIYHGIRQARPSGSHPASAGLGDNFMLMVARFEERKGHSYVVEAVGRLISEYPQYKDIRLGLIGDGPLLGKIKELVSKKGLNDNILFFGYRSDYIDFLADSLFLLNPSLGNEDLPYIILESMSLGVPVVGADVCGIPEEIEDGLSGIIVRPGDSPAITRAMRDLLGDQGKRRSIGAEAKKRFFSLFTIDKMIADYIGLYGRMLKA